MAVCALAVVALALQSQPTHLAGSARLSHLAGFAVLTFLVCMGLWQPGGRFRPTGAMMFAGLGALVVFGVGIELAQAVMSHSRDASLLDVAANGVGILAGYGAWALWWISSLRSD